MSFEDNKLRIRKTRDVEPLIQAIPAYAKLVNAERSRTGRLYLGSVDTLTAQNWAKECGHAIGTKPWREYANKKLQSGEFSKFRAPKPN